MQDLTEDQRKKVEEANKAYSEKAMPVFGRLTTARRELEALVNADKIDEAAIRAKAKDIADAEADLAIARGQRHAKLREFLSPEQARRFSQPTPIARPFQPALHDGQPPAPIAPAK
jgi:Spy/CpxP family protein refolding chaperone